MEKDRLGRIRPEDTLLLLIDVQEKFTPHIHNISGVIENCVRLVKGCRELGVPVIVTEQYPEGLGRTVTEAAAALGEFTPFEKTAFSVFEDEAIKTAIAAQNRPNLLLAGIESHVCLIKSALDALSEGYNVHWIGDCISSRTKENAEAAATRAIQSGALFSSTEMALFQMMSTAKDAHFRAISKIVK